MSHVVSQVFLTLAYIQPVFERDLLACEEKGGGGGRKRREQDEDRSRHSCSQPLQTTVPCGNPGRSSASAFTSACPEPVSSLERGFQTTSPPPWANRGTSDSLPILPAWLWQLVCEPGCDISARLRRLDPSLDNKRRLQLSSFPARSCRWGERQTSQLGQSLR